MGIRFGVVGTAYWASEVHAPGLREAEGVELVGLHGRSPEKTEAAARRNGVKAFARYEEMLEAVDAVSIAVSPEAQPAYAIQAARAGKHLLLEKPVGLDVEAARAVADAADRSGVAALVFFVRRFIPEIAATIASNRSRAWTRAEIGIHAAPLTTDSPYRNSVWRQAEGAALWDIGPHALPVLLPLMGPVTGARRLAAEPDHVRFALDHAAGGESEVSLTLRADPDRRESVHAFSGSNGALRLPDPAFSRTKVFAAAAGELVRMIRSGRRDHACGLDLGLETVRILAAVEGPQGTQGQP